MVHFLSKPLMDEVGTPGAPGTVWTDLLISTGLFRFAGSSDPTWGTWTIDSVAYQAMQFANNDEIFFSCQLPHSYKEGTDIRAHVHWTPRDRGVAESGKIVGWKLDVSWCNINNGIFDTSTTLDMSDACTGTSDYHEVGAAIAGLDGTGKKISSMLMCRLYRDDPGSGEWVGTTGAQSPVLLQFDFHHELDMSGSRIEWVK